MKLRDAFFIVGPTALGKSSIAAHVALRMDAEVLNADPFQAYAGLNILTAQPSAEAQAGTPHHLFGSISAAEPMSAAKFRELALTAMRHIAFRGKRAVVVSGSGLYVKALTDGFDRAVPPNVQLRRQLQQLPLATVVRQLQQLDPELAARTDLKNPRRVIRAIEIARSGNSPDSGLNPRPHGEKNPGAARRNVSGGVLLVRDREDLYARINSRVAEMFSRGVEEEIRRLKDIGHTAEAAIGLRQIRQLLADEISRQACVTKIQQATRRYAKRQLTWFRHQSNFPQLNLTGISHQEAVSAVTQMAQRHFAQE